MLAALCILFLMFTAALSTWVTLKDQAPSKKKMLAIFLFIVSIYSSFIYLGAWSSQFIT